MTNSIAEKSPAAVTAPREVTMEFSPIELQAPFLLRVGSMTIDYMVLLVLPVGALLYFVLFGEHITFMSDRTLWFVSVLLLIANIVILPLFTGRSIGKLLTGLRVVRNDGSAPGVVNIVLRQTVGYLLTAGTLGIGFVWCIFSSKGRTLHDIVTNTIVIRGNRREI